MICSLPIPGFEWKHRTDAYGTHQPVLFEAICRTKGPIVELGCGFNSTELIHKVAGERLVFSLEHDFDWLQKFKHMETNRRHFVLIEDWYEIISFFSADTDLSVVFIDQGLWASRAECVKFFKDRSELVIVHDSDYLERELGMNYNDHYKFVKTFMPLQPYPYITGPPTTIMSNTIDVTKWEIDYANYL